MESSDALKISKKIETLAFKLDLALEYMIYMMYVIWRITLGGKKKSFI